MIQRGLSNSARRCRAFPSASGRCRVPASRSRAATWAFIACKLNGSSQASQKQWPDDAATFAHHRSDLPAHLADRRADERGNVFNTMFNVVDTACAGGWARRRSLCRLLFGPEFQEARLFALRSADRSRERKPRARSSRRHGRPPQNCTPASVSKTNNFSNDGSIVSGERQAPPRRRSAFRRNISRHWSGGNFARLPPTLRRMCSRKSEFIAARYSTERDEQTVPG